MRCTGKGQVFLAENSADAAPHRAPGRRRVRLRGERPGLRRELQYEVRRIEGHGIPGGALFTMLFQRHRHRSS